MITLPLIKKRILLSLVAFLYSLLFRIAVDTDVAFRILFWFSEGGSVSLSEINRLTTFFYIVLALGLICFIVSKFEMIKGSFVFLYISSLLPFLLIPFRSRGGISMGWSFDAAISLISGASIGPAMIMLITYFVLKLFKKRRGT